MKQQIRGREVSCRDCLYVSDPNFMRTYDGSLGHFGYYRTTCCRRVPATTFKWTRNVDPFCGDFDDGNGPLSSVQHVPVDRSSKSRSGVLVDTEIAGEMEPLYRVLPCRGFHTVGIHFAWAFSEVYCCLSLDESLIEDAGALADPSHWITCANRIRADLSSNVSGALMGACTSDGILVIDTFATQVRVGLHPSRFTAETKGRVRIWYKMEE
jgi:hypothetical protein